MCVENNKKASIKQRKYNFPEDIIFVLLNIVESADYGRVRIQIK